MLILNARFLRVFARNLQSHRKKFVIHISFFGSYLTWYYTAKLIEYCISNAPTLGDYMRMYCYWLRPTISSKDGKSLVLAGQSLYRRVAIVYRSLSSLQLQAKKLFIIQLTCLLNRPLTTRLTECRNKSIQAPLLFHRLRQLATPIDNNASSIWSFQRI